MDIIKIKDAQGNWTTMSAFQGQPGAVPSFSIGTVDVGATTTDAAASISGTRLNPILNLTIPKGTQGDPGSCGVYSGPSEPTDPQTSVWIDTSVSGASIVTSVNGQTGNVTIPSSVSSVNGQTGDVTLPVGVTSVNAKTGAVTLTAPDVGSVEVELIWENLDSTVDFSAQTIIVDLSSYDAVLIESRYAKTTTFFGSDIIFVGTDGVTNLKGDVNATMTGRKVTVAQSGITFTTGYSGGTAGVTYAVPHRIFGIKGVKMT